MSIEPPLPFAPETKTIKVSTPPSGYQSEPVYDVVTGETRSDFSGDDYEDELTQSPPLRNENPSPAYSSDQGDTASSSSGNSSESSSGETSSDSSGDASESSSDDTSSRKSFGSVPSDRYDYPGARSLEGGAETTTSSNTFNADRLEEVLRNIFISRDESTNICDAILGIQNSLETICAKIDNIRHNMKRDFDD